MGIIIKEGFNFGFNPDACRRCTGKCCHGESGRIWADQQEILQISTFLKINPIDYIQRYLNRIENRYSIKERFTQDDFECVFFDGSKNICSIYPVRPFQCRKYPFWEHFRLNMEQAIRECPGIVVKSVEQ
jgi:Fe-S-cluster containining protein